MVSAGFWNRPGLRAKKPFDHTLLRAHDHLSALSAKGFWHIDSLLVSGLGAKLRSFYAGFVNPSLLTQFEDASRFKQMVEICRNVTTFELSIDTGINGKDEIGV